MASQLRIYKVKDGAMEEFVALWREHILPARAAHGFTVEGSWANPETGDFVWVVAHDGDFAAADAAYYASPERAAVPKDPRTFLDAVDLRLLEPVGG